MVSIANDKRTEAEVGHTAMAAEQPAPAEHHADVMSTLASGGKSQRLRGKVGGVLCGVPPERTQSLRLKGMVAAAW